jgi:hypothetical protein
MSSSELVLVLVLVLVGDVGTSRRRENQERIFSRVRPLAMPKDDDEREAETEPDGLDGPTTMKKAWVNLVDHTRKNSCTSSRCKNVILCVGELLELIKMCFDN